jgi:hypothetical protein
MQLEEDKRGHGKKADYEFLFVAPGSGDGKGKATPCRDYVRESDSGGQLG